jgi:hypothetical protein
VPRGQRDGSPGRILGFLDRYVVKHTVFKCFKTFIHPNIARERGPLSLVSTTKELLGRKSSGSGLESREYGRRDSSR